MSGMRRSGLGGLHKLGPLLSPIQRVQMLARHLAACFNLNRNRQSRPQLLPLTASLAEIALTRLATLGKMRPLIRGEPVYESQ